MQTKTFYLRFIWFETLKEATLIEHLFGIIKITSQFWCLDNRGSDNRGCTVVSNSKNNHLVHILVSLE